MEREPSNLCSAQHALQFSSANSAFCSWGTHFDLDEHRQEPTEVLTLWMRFRSSRVLCRYPQREDLSQALLKSAALGAGRLVFPLNESAPYAEWLHEQLDSPKRLTVLRWLTSNIFIYSNNGTEICTPTPMFQGQTTKN
eukprot:3269233-Amphidinium_carterae.1